MYLGMYDFVMFTCIGYRLPTFWEYMSIGEDSVRPSGAGLRNVHFLIICILILDTNCQHLGNICQLEGFCAPFGRRVRKYTFCNINILVLDINCQHFGNVCQLGGFCAPFGRRVVEYVWSGTCPGGSCLTWNLSGGKLSPWNLSFLDACLPGNLSGGKLSPPGICPQGYLSGGKLSRGNLSARIKDTLFNKTLPEAQRTQKLTLCKGHT